jgi:deoxyribodipyrimidine photo-lyase
MGSIVVMWFRRDLRLADHPALSAAVASGHRVLPLFVVDPAFSMAGGARQQFMIDALASLDAATGGALVYRHGDPAHVVPALAAEVGAAEVFVTRDFGPYGYGRDTAVAERLRSDGRRLVGVGTPYAVAPGAVVTGAGGGYRVFTPFRRAWQQHGWDSPSATPTVDWSGAPAVPCDGPPVAPAVNVPPSFGQWWASAGEASAHDRWERFRHGAMADYHAQRNDPAADATSKLSAALRWGIVHPRQLLADLRSDDPGVAGEHTFATELAWRDFYADVLARRPETARHDVNTALAELTYDTDQRALGSFHRWCAGRTGYPIVDAGMRQLAAMGWMHNRVRMIVASFLTKDLHLPWQWGARHFMRQLVDGDLASNSHGWQWTAGTGTDAAPYFRVFNPTSQGERFDPSGDYVRRWVPELADVAAAHIHAPGPLLRGSYPAPMVDHRLEREEALRRYRVAQGRPS